MRTVGGVGWVVGGGGTREDIQKIYFLARQRLNIRFKLNITGSI